MPSWLLPILTKLSYCGRNEALIEDVTGRWRHGQITERHVELGSVFLNTWVNPTVHAPKPFAIEIANHRFEEPEVQIRHARVHDLGSLVRILHDEARRANARFGEHLVG